MKRLRTGRISEKERLAVAVVVSRILKCLLQDRENDRVTQDGVTQNEGKEERSGG